MATIIVTESTCDLPREYIDAHPCLDVIPMVFQFGQEEHLEIAGETDEHANYERLRAGDVATTSQLNTAYLHDHLKKHLENGDDVIYLAFSSGLSGTCSNGMLAGNELREEFPDRKIVVVDTLAPSMMEGMLAIEAAKRLEATGEDVYALADYVKSLIPHMNAWFTVDDLKFLKRGGRISAATAALGTMLSIKPVLNVDDEGHLIAKGKERGRKRSIKAIVEHFMKQCPDPKNTPIYIGHGDCPEDAKQLDDMLYETAGVRAEMIGFIGMVIGSHSGPGTLALFFEGTNKG